MESRLRALKLKQSRMLLDVEMLSEVSDFMYLNIGKNAAEIFLLEKQIVRQTENPINED